MSSHYADLSIISRHHFGIAIELIAFLFLLCDRISDHFILRATIICILTIMTTKSEH